MLRKRIPVAAGLGGGSSDAAAVLRALRGDRDPNELHAIARALGADVPFFLTGAETGFGTGRGDRIQPLPDFPRGHAFVLVPSDRGLATGEVFAACEPNPIFRAVEGDLVRAMHTVRRGRGRGRADGERPRAGRARACAPTSPRRSMRCAARGRWPRS